MEVDPDPRMLPNDLIGRRVRTWWPSSKKWYSGVVENRKKRQHVVRYEDGEVRAERLMGYKKPIQWKLLVRRGSDELS